MVGRGSGGAASPCGSSVKGTCREDSLAGDPEGYVEKALKTGISFHRGPIWGTWRSGHLPGTLRDGRRGSRDGASLSEEAPWGSLRVGELLHWGPWKIYQERL